ncbi:MAG: hypothetical protein LAO76_02785 [Acidobacteriia bacterium]|nr:hypothetical protein [Terriglobia bacterium]
MQIKTGQMVFLIGHRGAASKDINSVVLQLSVALTPEDVTASKSDSFMLAIPADYAEKIISSIRSSLENLRQSK